MIKFTAYYYNSEDGCVDHLQADFWEDLPADDLLFVDIHTGQYRHRLLGADFYWFKDNRYGMIYDGTWCDVGASSWTIDDNYKTIKDSSYTEPESVHMLIGKMLPDDEWYRIEEDFR